jgi:hypothetical protein
VVLQWCYSNVTVVLQWRYSGVTVMLQWYYSGVTVILRNVLILCCYVMLAIMVVKNWKVRSLLATAGF